jgi:predicted RNA-binding Zn ribbon-like protein
VVIPAHIAELELRGNDVALDFANTLEGTWAEPGTEHLGEYTDLSGWAAHAGLVADADGARLLALAADDADGAAAAVRAATALRAVVFDVFAPLAVGDRAPRAALHALREVHRAALARATLAPRGPGRHEWTWDGDDLERPLWPVTVAAVDLLRDGPRLQRLKICAQCRWLFLDQSRNHSRRWCSMSECGAQVKMRRYRAAHRDRR